MNRLFPLLAAALVLAGCNVVASREPLLGPQDASGPQLRPGVWATASPNCYLAPRAPAYRWPGCSEWMLARPGEILTLLQDGKGWQSMAVVLAGEGPEPQILQIRERDPDAKPGEPDVTYIYAAVRTLERDRQGRATRLRMWVLVCGPEPPKDATWPDGSRRYVSLQLYPGLKAEQGDQNCAPTDLASVRGVAAAMERQGVPGDGETLRWVRDGYP